MALLDPRAMRDWCKQKFLSKDNVLKTKETVEANEKEGKSVDALVIKEVFQSVGNGKSLVASAITDKGVQTDATATFQEMAEHIGQIETGGGSGNINWNVAFVEITGIKVNKNIVVANNGGKIDIDPQEGA